MEKDFVVIYTTGQAYQAEIAKELLEDHQIQAVILNQKDSMYKFGDIEVYVHQDNREQAEEILKKLKN